MPSFITKTYQFNAHGVHKKLLDMKIIRADNTAVTKTVYHGGTR